MTPEEFRQAGHTLIDWLADQRLAVDQQPVRSEARPGQVADAFSAEPPLGGSHIEALLAQLDSHVVPGLTQMQHPSNFAWFPANASLASVLGDMASSGLGALGITWQSAPALTELETVTCDWLRKLCGLSDAWHGVINDTASTSCLVALICARERALGDARSGGLTAGPPLAVYASDQAHSSIIKGASLAGFGSEHLRLIPTDPVDRSLDVEALGAAVAHDIEQGITPAGLVVCAGTTGTTAFDAIGPATGVARAAGMWVHLDAAMAGSALLLDECRHLFDGIEEVDSISWNPHKWMGTVLDCSMFLVRDPAWLRSVMSSEASYLASHLGGTEPEVIEYKDWGIPLGRRFRALKLWFHLSIDGPDAIRERLRRDMENARWLALRVEAEPGWDLVAPVQLQTVCVRHGAGAALAPKAPGSTGRAALGGEALEAHTLAWVEAINASGAALLTPSKLDGSWMVRVSIGAEATEAHHVEAVWELMRRAAEESFAELGLA